MIEVCIFLSLFCAILVVGIGIACLSTIKVYAKEKRKLEKAFTRLEHEALKHGLYLYDKVEGLLNKTIIQAKIAEKYSARAHDMALDAITRVGALENATHKVQFVPIKNPLEQNPASQEKLDRLFNPGDEDYDWLEPVEVDPMKIIDSFRRPR